MLQTKLQIGEANDRFEREADRVAEEVMRMPEPRALERAAISGSASSTQIQRVCRACEEGLSSRTIAIQRFCPECEEELHRQTMEEEDEEVTIQAKEISGRTPKVTLEYAVAGQRSAGRRTAVAGVGSRLLRAAIRTGLQRRTSSHGC